MTPHLTDLAPLLSLIAHELRTPLSVTSGYLKMLAAERPGPLTDGQRHAVQGASRSCDQLTALAADVSLLGRLERGEVSPKPARLDVSALVSEMVKAYVPHPDHPVVVEVAGTGQGAPDDPTDVPRDLDADAPTDEIGPSAPVAGGPWLLADTSHVRRTLSTLLAAVVRAAPDEATVQIGWLESPIDPSRLRVGVALATELDEMLRADDNGLDPLDESQAGLGMALPVARRLMALEDCAIHSMRHSQGLGLCLTLPLPLPRSAAP